jgi:hypothetical protein
MSDNIFGTIYCIVLVGCNWIQDLNGWYHPWNYLVDSVIWVQLNTGLTRVVSSWKFCWIVFDECNCL